MIFRGKAWKFGDNVSTDLISPGRYTHLRSNLPEYAKHVLEVANPDFPKNVQKGDFIVAGRNFGQGSSREVAPMIIKLAGIDAVLAKSFARIFYRNSINIGLCALICDTDPIDHGDRLEVDLDEGVIRDVDKGIEIKVEPMPKIMQDILNSGGLLEYIKKHGNYVIK